MSLSRDNNRGEQHYILTVRFNVKRSPLEKQAVEYLFDQMKGIKPVNGKADPMRIVLCQLIESMIQDNVQVTGDPIEMLRSDMNHRLGFLQTMLENVGLEVLAKMDNLQVGIVPTDSPTPPLDAVPDDFLDFVLDDHNE